MKRSITAVIAVAAVFGLGACDAPKQSGTSTTPQVSQSVPGPQVDVQTGWTGTRGRVGDDSFRVVKVNGTCFLELEDGYHGAPALSPIACS